MNLGFRVVSFAFALATFQLAVFAFSAHADEASGAEVEVAAAVPETITLVSGDTLTGLIIAHDDEGVTMDHAVLGRIRIPTAEIAVETPEPETPGLFGTSFLRGATRTIGFGISGATGNSDTLGMSATLAISKETERHRGNFNAVYVLGTQSGIDTQNQFFTSYVHDFLFPDSKFFLFGNARFDYDQFRSWDQRIAAAAGVGYEIFKDDRFELQGRLGFGFSKTFGTTIPPALLPPPITPAYLAREAADDWIPEMQVGVDFYWTIIEGMRFRFSNTYIPDLSDISEFRNLTDAGYEVDIGLVRGLSFKFGIENEYISSSPFPSKKNNLVYIGNLAYSL